MYGTLDFNNVKELADKLDNETFRRMNPALSRDILLKFQEWRMAPDFEEQAVEVKKIIEDYLANPEPSIKHDPRKGFTIF